MIKDYVEIKNIKGIKELSVCFQYPASRTIVITGKNGIGKTTLVKAFNLISDPQIYQLSSGESSIHTDSEVHLSLNGYKPFSFTFNSRVRALDTRDEMPPQGQIIAELPIPFGKRFQHFSLVAANDADLRANIASSDYRPAEELSQFLKNIYSTDKYASLNSTRIKKNEFYFFLKEKDYYLREDYLSSGEFFLIQIFRLITSGAKLIIVDELDVALDASAQVKLFSAIKPLLEKYEARLIVISHSLAFMETVDDGGLYYLEESEGVVMIEQRSYGYIKSDLYGFHSKDRYILTEDPVLSGFIKYLIKTQMSYFFEHEIIEIGGNNEIDKIAHKNDVAHIFGDQSQVLIITDKDVFDKLKYSGSSPKYSSPVNDIEIFIWENRNQYLSGLAIPEFQPAKSVKKTAKTFWRKIIASDQITADDLYDIVLQNNIEETQTLINGLKEYLCI